MLMLAACAPSPYEQSFSGHLVDGTIPVATRVKIAERDCGQPGPIGSTDVGGRFQLTELYRPTATETVAVLVHHYRLCVERGSSWVPIWSFTSGPAPRSLEFDCDLSRDRKQQCRAFWNGRAIHDQPLGSSPRASVAVEPANNKLQQTKPGASDGASPLHLV
jgi:hypothetical protein